MDVSNEPSTNYGYMIVLGIIVAIAIVLVVVVVCKIVEKRANILNVEGKKNRNH